MPDQDGIVSVRHHWHNQDLDVKCFREDGSSAPYMVAHAVAPDQVEVLTLPGSGVVAVELRPLVAGQGV